MSKLIEAAQARSRIHTPSTHDEKCRCASCVMRKMKGGFKPEYGTNSIFQSIAADKQRNYRTEYDSGVLSLQPARDLILKHDERRAPFGRARAAVIIALWEPPTTMTIGRMYLVLDALHEYESLRGGLRSPSAQALMRVHQTGLGVNLTDQDIAIYERCRGLE